MLTLVPPRMSDEERALLNFAHRVEEVRAHHALLGVTTGFYLLGAFTLAFSPDVQLFTQGTRPVFALFPPLVWAVWFVIAGGLVGSLCWRLSGRRQIATWMVALPCQTVWIAASLIAVARGGGSSMGAVFLTVVFAFSLVTVFVTWRAYTSGKR